MNWKVLLFRHALKKMPSSHLENFSDSLAAAFSLPDSIHEKCIEITRTLTIDKKMTITTRSSVRVKPP